MWCFNENLNRFVSWTRYPRRDYLLELSRTWPACFMMACVCDPVIAARRGHTASLKWSPNLSWDFKIRVATEIASGLVFCHTFDILHHDIRRYAVLDFGGGVRWGRQKHIANHDITLILLYSHNILLTADLTAKIGNFESARKDAEDTMPQIPDLNLRYR